MKKISKTELAAQALIAAGEITNRGHAYKVLAEAELCGSGVVFNGAIKAYCKHAGISELGKSASAQRREDEKRARANAHQSSAEEVLEHIASIKAADQKFWDFWHVFKYEGKWQNKLSTSDFAVHFNK